MSYRRLFFCLAVLFVFLAYLFYDFYGEAKRKAIAELNSRQMLHAEQAAQGITDYFDHWIDTLKSIAQQEDIQTLDHRGQAELKSFLESHQAVIRSVSRLDAEGRILYLLPEHPGIGALDFASQKHIREVRKTRQPVVSDVFSTVQGFDAVAIHVPVFRGKTFSGTVGITIDFQVIARRYLEKIRIGETGYAWMISRDGTELYCPVPGHTGKSVFENCRNFPSILAMANEMVQGRQGVTTYQFDMIRGETVEAASKLAVYRPIRVGNTFWSIVVASSEEEMIATLNSFRNKLIIVIGLLLAGGGFFSFFGMRAWGIVREEEKRKKMEEALRASEDRYRFLFEAAPVGIALTNSEGRIRDANSFLLKILGYTVEEARNLTVEAVYVNPDDRLRLLDAMQLHGYLREWEVLFRRKDGSVFDGLLDARKIEYGGEPLFLTTIRDITDLRRGEGERKVLEERLSRMEKMESLGMLAGGVAHDLNNVLGILVGYSELLLDDLDPDSPLREHVRNILLGGERAAAIVQDLLTMARRGVQNRDVVNLNTIIAELQATPEYAKLCSSHSGVRVEALLEAELLNIQGSPMHLSKTLLNLLNNAMEAMRRGGRVTIRTENLYLDHPVAGYDEVREGDYVLLSVTDAGEGIAPENLKRIFEPFYTKKVMGRSGTGLGLAVVWGTVKDHCGYIDIRSEPGRGSTFSLYFPVTREEGVRPETVAPVAYLGRGESLLVIDDVQEQRELAVMMLTKLGYRVEALSSGKEAVEYLKQKKMDLVVLDMIMDPGMDGLDTYREILKLHPKQKAIIVSGFAETDRVRSAQELGAGAYVKKPYMLGRIGMAVRKELDRI